MSKSSVVRVVAFDPGGTTGWATVEVDLARVAAAGLSVGLGSLGARWKTGSIRGGSGGGDAEASVRVGREMADVVARFLGSGGVVVVEDFVLDRGRSSGRRDLLAPVRLTTALRVWLAVDGWDGRVVLQMPADAKAAVTNDRLRAWGAWVKGSDHERDAMRHALLYLRRAASDS